MLEFSGSSTFRIIIVHIAYIFRILTRRVVFGFVHVFHVWVDLPVHEFIYLLMSRRRKIHSSFVSRIFWHVTQLVCKMLWMLMIINLITKVAWLGTWHLYFVPFSPIGHGIESAVCLYCKRLGFIYMHSHTCQIPNVHNSLWRHLDFVRSCPCTLHTTSVSLLSSLAIRSSSSSLALHPPSYPRRAMLARAFPWALPYPVSVVVHRCMTWSSSVSDSFQEPPMSDIDSVATRSHPWVI